MVVQAQEDSMGQIVGRIPKNVRINKNKLKVDTRKYQRAKYERLVDKITREFSWNAFGALVVNLRKDGSMWVLDGGHRLGAAKDRDEVTTVPCALVCGLTLEEESEAFIQINKQRKAMQGLETWKGELMAKRPSALLLNSLLVRHGFVVGPNVSQGEVRSTSSIMKYMVKKADGAEGVDWALCAAKNLWGTEVSKHTQLHVILGAARFYLKFKESGVDPQLLAKEAAVRFPSLENLTVRADRLVGERALCFRDAMILAWDKGRKTNRIAKKDN